MPGVARVHDERGQVVVLFALLIPTFLTLVAVVIAGGNWYTHAKHLQTKVDAGALAGGQVWGFPCGPDSDSNAQGAGIVDVARYYVGSQVTAGGTVYNSPLNAQVGGVPGSDVHVVINGNDYWDDDAGLNPADQTTPAGSVCEAKILDVKATEGNSFPLASILPLFPDIKRKARVRIEESAGVSGLLPVAVRIPRPLSAVAVYYNEQNGNIISSQYMREVCIPGVTFCVPFAPVGLGQWTTDPASATATIPGVSVATTTGVVIASSFRAACNVAGATAPCLDASPAGVTNIDAFCNQNRTVTCWDATGPAGSLNVEAGVQFIRGYGNTPTGTGPPQLRSAYLRPSGCEPYFNSLPTACAQILNVEVDLGALESLYPVPPGPPPGPLTRLPLRAEDVQVRYRLVRSNGTTFCNYGNTCELLASPTASGTVTFSTTGAGNSPLLPIDVDSWENSVAIEIRLRDVELPNDLPAACSDSNFNANCRWYYTATSISPSVAPTDAQILASPIQRSFMGSVDRTGPLRWLRLDIDPQCNNDPFDGGGRLFGWVDPPPTADDAASRPVGSSPCYVVNMALQGGMARDQDEPPVALLLGSGSSQRALVDCDPNVPFGQIEEEIQYGCQYPAYRGNKFDDPPGPSGWCPWGDDTPGTFFTLPKPAPFDDWNVAFDCVLTRPTAAANQMMQGFNQRLFGVSNNPACPADDPNAEFQPGRNYWHRVNNSNQTYGFAWDGTPAQPPYAARGTNFSDQDKRVVSLFLTPYGSFTGTGTQVQELVGLGSFYVTGYGRINGGNLNIEDPCSDGASSPVYQWAGNDPPPDLDLSKNTTVLWGHFIKDVPGGAFGGTGILCEPQLSFNPCVPVLVE